MSGESTPLPPKPEERRGRPKGSKDTKPRLSHQSLYKSVMLDGDTKKGQGHRRLRGTQMLHVQNEIRQRIKAGESLVFIETQMKLAKGAAFKSMYGNKERRLMKIIVDEIMLDTFLIVAEGCEVVKNEVVHMKAKSVVGELNFSPEQLGTFVRTIDKARELHHAITGKPLLALEMTKEAPKDPALERARERLEEMEAQGQMLDE